MGTNPNPALITDPMWNMWEQRPNEAWKLSGIYANKPGYHNSYNANKRNWPGNYSIQLPLDNGTANRTKARAIDYTMSESEMIKTTKRLKKSAEDPNDNRLAALKEFFGTLDGKNVFGMGKNDTDGPWRLVTSDKSHLWHLHLSIFMFFVNNWHALAPILSVLRGESLADWGMTMELKLPKQGDTGEVVKYWQYVHNTVRKTVDPPAIAVIADGDYGKATSAAFSDFWSKVGGTGKYDGTALTAWLCLQYHKKLALVSNPQALASEEKMKEFVNAWMATNVNTENLTIKGTLTGKVSL